MASTHQAAIMFHTGFDQPRASRDITPSDQQLRDTIEGILDGNNESSSTTQLEKADGGPAAWRLLVAAFFFEGVLYGFSLSFGVFQNYYALLPEYRNSALIPFVGSVATGMVFLGAPFMTPVVRRYPNYQRQMIWCGWLLSITGLAVSSLVSTLPGLILTQGVLYGLGFVILYYPIISMVNEWWIVRRGFAWGIIASASGISGCIFPLIIEALLKRWGHHTTLRAIAIATLILTGPLLPLFKTRYPPSQHGVLGRTDWSFLKKPLFWVYSTSNIAQGLGFFFPSIFIPSYATHIGLSSSKGALLLALMSMAQVLGQFTFGWLSDGRLPLNLLAMTSTLMAAMASFTLWGLAHSLALLVGFVLVYGFFGYGYVSIRVRMGTAITTDPTAALAMFSLFCFGQGVGNVLTAPISSGLVSQIRNNLDYGATKYKAVVIFTGCCMIISALSIGSWYIIRPRRPRTR